VRNGHDISNYYPDFIVKKNDSEIYIIETKGLEDPDVPLKAARLDQWCTDMNNQKTGVEYRWLLVKQEEFEDYTPKNFDEAIKVFSNNID
jgi:type III restriction enzyme